MALSFHSMDPTAQTITFGDPNGVAITVYLDPWPATQEEAITQAKQIHSGIDTLSQDRSALKFGLNETSVEL